MPNAAVTNINMPTNPNIHSDLGYLHRAVAYLSVHRKSLDGQNLELRASLQV